VLSDLLVQSGLLREPTPGRIDFIHRTFQEYLAGKAAIEGNEIGLVLDHAFDVQWHEVIIMAAGHAQPWQRAELIRGLLDDRLRIVPRDENRTRIEQEFRRVVDGYFRGTLDDELRQRFDETFGGFLSGQERQVLLSEIYQGRISADGFAYSTGPTFSDVFELLQIRLASSDKLSMNLLPLACMQTAPQVDADLQEIMDDVARTLIPPKTLEVADSLGAAGRFVLDLLADCEPTSSVERAAIIRTAAVIGHPDGMSLIARHAGGDPRCS
jgi:hypothetical protein